MAKNVAPLDKLVHIACALINVCPSVVTMDRTLWSFSSMVIVYNSLIRLSCHEENLF